jgi:hypothetical protein
VGCQSSLKHGWSPLPESTKIPQTGESCLGGNHIVSISNTSGISTQPLFGNVWEYFSSQDQILTLSDLPSSTFHAFCVLRLEGTWTYLRFACEGSTCLFCFSTRSFRIKFGHQPCKLHLLYLLFAVDYLDSNTSESNHFCWLPWSACISWFVFARDLHLG